MTDLLFALALAVLPQAGHRPAPAPPGEEVEFKMATLVPEGSIWDREERLFAQACGEATAGRVRFRIYPGGVAGDEPDVLRKIRLGQLQGGILTAAGLGDVAPDLRVLDIPLLLHTDAEARVLLDELGPRFRQELEAKGLVLLHWGPVGWIRFFSKKPVETVDDLKRQKQFVWAGQGNMARWFEEAGFHPVPLPATDMLSGLNTGLIEALPSTPLTALSLQWFRAAPNMLDEPIAPLLGATVVDARRWGKLSEADRQAVLAEAAKVEERLFEEVPRQEEKAIEEMRQRGLNVTTIPDGARPAWLALADHFAKRMSGNEIEAETVRRARAVLAKFRESAR